MNISLSKNLENILKAKVAEDAFCSMDEVITFDIQFTFVFHILKKYAIIP